MNSFSFNRFGKTLRWVMAVNSRTLLMWTIGSVVAVFAGELMTAEMRNLSAYEMVNLYGTMGSALFVLVSLIMASTIVSSVNEKRKRQAFLMMPSTNLEKYLSLLVYTSVICVACISLALVLGDCLRMVWFKTASFFVVHQVQASVSDPVETYHGWSSALPKLIENLTPNVLDPDSDRRTWFYNASHCRVESFSDGNLWHTVAQICLCRRFSDHHPLFRPAVVDDPSLRSVPVLGRCVERRYSL